MSDNHSQSITESLARNVLRLGNEVRELTEKLKKAERRAESLREAGDEIWYCYRHREPLHDAIKEWVEARDGLKGDQP
jgi:predicted ribosome quality control (RQC) complex YloA/Tae2 family protein